MMKHQVEDMFAVRGMMRPWAAQQMFSTGVPSTGSAAIPRCDVGLRPPKFVPALREPLGDQDLPSISIERS